MGEKILLTGITGNVGTAVVEYLKSENSFIENLEQ